MVNVGCEMGLGLLASGSVHSGPGAQMHPCQAPVVWEEAYQCQGHSSLDAPSELNPPQRIPSPLYFALLVPQAEG